VLQETLPHGLTEGEAMGAAGGALRSSLDRGAARNSLDAPHQHAPAARRGGGAAVYGDQAVEMLIAMGFQKMHAQMALKQCAGNLERAGNYFSKVSLYREFV
jgi:hypothetical protein